MALLDRIQTDMVAAMRAKEEMKLNAIRMIKTALKKHEVDSMKPLDEATELQILGMLIKQRREAAEMFRKGDRAEIRGFHARPPPIILLRPFEGGQRDCSDGE